MKDDEFIPLPPCPISPEVEEFLREQQELFELVTGAYSCGLADYHGNRTLKAVMIARGYR